MNKKGLIIGINTYKDDNFEDLKWAENDAQSLYNTITDEDIGGFPEKNVTLLTSNDKNSVTKTFIEEKLEEVFINSEEGDLILIYFAGHGDTDNLGNLCFAAYDTKKARLLSSSINFSFIKGALSENKSKKVVFLFDCCYSGNVKQSVGFRGSSIPLASFEESSGEGIIFITATKSFQLAREDDDLGHGVFTRYLVEGLKDGKADRDNTGYITIDELYNYTYEMVKKNTHNSQVPMKWGLDEKGHIVIAKNRYKSKSRCKFEFIVCFKKNTDPRHIIVNVKDIKKMWIDKLELLTKESNVICLDYRLLSENSQDEIYKLTFEASFNSYLILLNLYNKNIINDRLALIDDIIGFKKVDTIDIDEAEEIACNQQRFYIDNNVISDAKKRLEINRK